MVFFVSSKNKGRVRVLKRRLKEVNPGFKDGFFDIDFTVEALLPYVESKKVCFAVRSVTQAVVGLENSLVYVDVTDIKRVAAEEVSYGSISFIHVDSGTGVDDVDIFAAGRIMKIMSLSKGDTAYLRKALCSRIEWHRSARAHYDAEPEKEAARLAAEEALRSRPTRTKELLLVGGGLLVTAGMIGSLFSLR